MILKKIRLSLTFTVLTLLLLSSTTVLAQSTPNIKRLSGSNRYGTSSAVALSKWSQSDYAILAFGGDFPDALSAAPLAKKYNAPILLTESNSLPAETLNAIQQLKVKTIFIIGGTGVISSTVEIKITSLGIKITRIFGQNRYETGIKVAEQLDNITEIALVTGESFADALSISPIAVKKNMAIILVQSNIIPSVVRNYINSHKLTRIYAIGLGTSINTNALAGLSNVESITGDDKYKVNLNIIDKFKSDLDLSTIYVATGENFADALSGSILAGSNSNPLVLIGDNPINQKDYYTNNSSLISNINILGGTGAVDDDTMNKLIGVTATELSEADIERLQSYEQYSKNDGIHTSANYVSFQDMYTNERDNCDFSKDFFPSTLSDYNKAKVGWLTSPKLVYCDVLTDFCVRGVLSLTYNEENNFKLTPNVKYQRDVEYRLIYSSFYTGHLVLSVEKIKYLSEFKAVK